MLLLVLYCGFYLSGLFIAQLLTLRRQALISGIATTLAAVVAALTLWLFTQSTLIEPWLAIAMIGTIALPALMLGLGLLAGWWIRQSGNSKIVMAIAALPALATVLLPILS